MYVCVLFSTVKVHNLCKIHSVQDSTQNFGFSHVCFGYFHVVHVFYFLFLSRQISASYGSALRWVKEYSFQFNKFSSSASLSLSLSLSPLSLALFCVHSGPERLWKWLSATTMGEMVYGELRFGGRREYPLLPLKFETTTEPPAQTKNVQ